MTTLARRRRGAAPADSGEEETRSSRGTRTRTRSSGAAEEPSRSRRRSSNEDDPGSRSTRGSSSRGTSSGWAAYSSKRVVGGGGFADDFKPKEGESLVKILDPEPFAVYLQHWIDDVPKGKKKSYVCAEEDCPLCDIGDRPSTISVFNVVDLNGKDPETKVWRTTVTVADLLDAASKEKRSSPIDREDLYFVVKHDVKGKRHSYSLIPIKADDLQEGGDEEDWDVEPLSAEEIDLYREDSKTKLSEIMKVDTREFLDDLAGYLLDGGSYPDDDA